MRINDGEEQWEGYIRYVKEQIKIKEVPNLVYWKDDRIQVNPIRTFDLKKCILLNMNEWI